MVSIHTIFLAQLTQVIIDWMAWEVAEWSVVLIMSPYNIRGSLRNMIGPVSAREAGSPNPSVRTIASTSYIGLHGNT